MKTSRLLRRMGVVLSIGLSALMTGAGAALLGNCGPFTDVAQDVFCPFVLEIFYLGITTGTTATTYDPTSNVSRLQMAAFLSRTVDGVLKRGGRRAALDQFWTTQNSTVMGMTDVGTDPTLIAFDGADVWVANEGTGTVSRVRASDGKLLETWTGATAAWGVLVAMGKIIVTGEGQPSSLYQIDPSAAAGVVTTVATNLGDNAQGISFDGTRIWVGNVSSSSVSIVTPGASLPWTVTTVTTGFDGPVGTVFDGSNIWIADNTGLLRKVDSSGAILQTVTLAVNGGEYPVFDGSNIWLPLSGGPALAVVRASTGAVLGTLTGNGIGADVKQAAFDGQRILVTSYFANTLSLWKAADLTPLGFVQMETIHPLGVCSDGVNFWIALNIGHAIARF